MSRPITNSSNTSHRKILRLRFFGVVRELSHMEMARLTQIDYEREMAFIATAPDAEGTNETLAVVRASAKPDNSRPSSPSSFAPTRRGRDWASS